MRLLCAIMTAVFVAGCSSISHPVPRINSQPNTVDPMVEFLQHLPTMPSEELDQPKNQRKLAECIVCATSSKRAQLLSYLSDPEATEYLLVNASDFDAHLASRLIAELMEEARVRVALTSACPSTRVVAALAVRSTDSRRAVIRQSKDTTVRNAYAETLDASEVELLTLLAADPDKEIAHRASSRMR